MSRVQKTTKAACAAIVASEALNGSAIWPTPHLLPGYTDRTACATQLKFIPHTLSHEFS